MSDKETDNARDTIKRMSKDLQNNGMKKEVADKKAYEAAIRYDRRKEEGR